MNRNRGLRMTRRAAASAALLLSVSLPCSAAGSIATASARIGSPTRIVVDAAPAELRTAEPGSTVRLEAGALQFSANRKTAFSASVSILDSRVTHVEEAPANLSIEQGRLSSGQAIEV